MPAERSDAVICGLEAHEAVELREELLRGRALLEEPARSVDRELLLTSRDGLGEKIGIFFQ